MSVLFNFFFNVTNLNISVCNILNVHANMARHGVISRAYHVADRAAGIYTGVAIYVINTHKIINNLGPKFVLK